MYEEAESNANGFGRFAIAEAHKYMRRSRIAKKPRAMQMNLFGLHCRGAPGYAADVFALGYSPA